MKHLLTITIGLLFTITLNAQVSEMTVETKKIGAEIQPTMYGLFFEDINYAADGGLYAELIKNRSFEFPQNLMGWETYGNVVIKNDGPFERNPHYVHLSYAGHDHKHTGLQNEGFFGVAVEKNKEYRFSVWARATEGNSKISVELVDVSSNGERQTFVSQELSIDSKEWKKYEIVLESPETHMESKLRIFL